MNDQTTLRSNKSPAELCRERGWKAGTRIVGDEGRGPTVIEITAVGEEAILAKAISHNGEPLASSLGEGNWALHCRDWRKVGD